MPEQLKLRVYDGCIYYLIGKTQYWTCMTLIRLQEFYESPYKEIYGKYFTLEDYMDRYVEEFGTFEYLTEINGFNVPGEVVREFFELYKGRLTDKEKVLEKLLRPALRSKKDFYFIATYEIDNPDPAVTEHEMSHAFYHLCPEYKDKMDQLVSKYPKLDRLHEKLIEMGYSESVMADENFPVVITELLFGRSNRYLKMNTKECLVTKKYK
jgi:hypothetical protein